MKNKPEFCVLLRFSEIIFYDGAPIKTPLYGLLRIFQNLNFEMATLWSCRQIEKIIVSPYSAEKIKKNKLQFCILLKFHEISIMSCRRFDLAVKLKKYLCHRFVLKKPWKINPIFVSF